MASEEENTFDDSPIITYSNRIQKHMFILTDFIGTADLAFMNNLKTARIKLLALIQNLPPQGKQNLKDIYQKVEVEKTDTYEFLRWYGLVSDWIYTNILQDAFKAKPRMGKGKF